MADAFLIVEDRPLRRAFLEKKLKGAAMPWLLCDSSAAAPTLKAMGANCIVVDIAGLQGPFAALWQRLEEASGDGSSPRLIFTGIRVSEIVAAQRHAWWSTRQYCEIYGFRTLLELLGAKGPYSYRRRHGIPRWRRHGARLLRTGIGLEPKQLSQADWRRYALQFIHHEGAKAYFSSLLEELRVNLGWLKTVYPPGGRQLRAQDGLNPLGTGLGPFSAEFTEKEWLRFVLRTIGESHPGPTVDRIAALVAQCLAPWRDFGRWCDEGRAYRIVVACPGIRMTDPLQDLRRVEAAFVRLPRSAEKKRALRVLGALERLGIQFERGYGYLEAWTTIPTARVSVELPERDRPFVFFLRGDDSVEAYLWPEGFTPVQDVRKIPCDRPLSEDEIEISRMEKRGPEGEDEFFFAIPYPLKMTMSTAGLVISRTIDEILADEELLGAFGMTAEYREETPRGVQFRAARAWASEGGFEVSPLDQPLDVESQLRTYENRLESRYVYREDLARRLRFLGVELFNRILAARRMKRL